MTYLDFKDHLESNGFVPNKIIRETYKDDPTDVYYWENKDKGIYVSKSKFFDIHKNSSLFDFQASLELGESIACVIDVERQVRSMVFQYVGFTPKVKPPKNLDLENLLKYVKILKTINDLIPEFLWDRSLISTLYYS
jgi:hypothetical protein